MHLQELGLWRTNFDVDVQSQSQLALPRRCKKAQLATRRLDIRKTPIRTRTADVDLRVRLRFEQRQAGADRVRFLHEQGERNVALDGRDAGFETGGGVSIGQQPPDRSRLAPDFDPAPANLSRPGLLRTRLPWAGSSKRVPVLKKRETRWPC